MDSFQIVSVLVSEYWGTGYSLAIGGFSNDGVGFQRALKESMRITNVTKTEHN